MKLYATAQLNKFRNKLVAGLLLFMILGSQLSFLPVPVAHADEGVTTDTTETPATPTGTTTDSAGATTDVPAVSMDVSQENAASSGAGDTASSTPVPQTLGEIILGTTTQEAATSTLLTDASSTSDLSIQSTGTLENSTTTLLNLTNNDQIGTSTQEIIGTTTPDLSLVGLNNLMATSSGVDLNNATSTKEDEITPLVATSTDSLGTTTESL